MPFNSKCFVTYLTVPITRLAVQRLQGMPCQSTLRLTNAHHQPLFPKNVHNPYSPENQKNYPPSGL